MRYWNLMLIIFLKGCSASGTKLPLWSPAKNIFRVLFLITWKINGSWPLLIPVILLQVTQTMWNQIFVPIKLPMILQQYLNLWMLTKLFFPESQQSKLIGLSRSSHYRRRNPAEEPEKNLWLMRLIDEEYTRHPFLGGWKMRDYLTSESCPDNILPINLSYKKKPGVPRLEKKSNFSVIFSF